MGLIKTILKKFQGQVFFYNVFPMVFQNFEMFPS
jgi:hypothetical protein